MDINVAVNVDLLNLVMAECKRDVESAMVEAGERFVQDAIAEGTYRNRTGNLRRSNFYEVEEDGLGLGNKADYASDVESRGYEVCSTCALRAAIRLQDTFGK